MALQQSGRISLNDIRGEFGGTGQLRLSQYYRGGGRVPNTPKNQSISTGGRIAHSMFYGASKELSPKEIIDLANASKTDFYRLGTYNYNRDYISSTPSPVSYWSNGNWPSHKSGAGVFGYTWNFSNLGYAPSEDKCFIVVSQGGRNHSSNTVRNVYSSVRGYVAFREIYRTPGYSQSSISAYEADCDRREVATVITDHSGDGGGNGSSAAMYILPGGGWSKVSYKPSLVAENHQVFEGDFVAVASGHNKDNTQSTGLGWSYYLGGGNHWYGGGYLGAVYGVTGGTWSSGNTNLFYGPNAKAVYFRRVQAGEDLTRYRDVVVTAPNYGTVTGSYSVTTMGGKNTTTTWRTSYATCFYFRNPGGGIGNNGVTIISATTNVGGLSFLATTHASYGMCYFFYAGSTMATAPTWTGNYTATVTVENGIGERHTFSFTGSISTS